MEVATRTKKTFEPFERVLVLCDGIWEADFYNRKEGDHHFVIGSPRVFKDDEIVAYDDHIRHLGTSLHEDYITLNEGDEVIYSYDLESLLEQHYGSAGVFDQIIKDDEDGYLFAIKNKFHWRRGSLLRKSQEYYSASLVKYIMLPAVFQKQNYTKHDIFTLDENGKMKRVE